MHLADHIPDVEVLLALEPDELGLRMLPVLARWKRHEQLELGTFFNITLGHPQAPANSSVAHSRYPQVRRNEIEQALGEAWAWLEGAALLIPSREYIGAHTIRVLSRRAQQLAKEHNPRQAFGERRIPKDALNENIREDVWALYHRGKYDTAVFEAMKAVEVAVRAAAGLTSKDIGTGLMRKAFEPDTGPLTDMNTEKAEREARSHLFTGAIGSYKNPHSHRYVALDDPDEAAEIIMLANHMLRIVDARVEAKSKP